MRVRPSCLQALFICLAELKHLKLHGLSSKAKVLKSFLVAQGALPMVVGCHSSELDCNWPSLCAGWRVSSSLIPTVSVPWIAGPVGLNPEDVLKKQSSLTRMSSTNQQCACEPCGCTVSPENSVEQGGKVYCSQPCADGHAGQDKCCSSCDCC